MDEMVAERTARKRYRCGNCTGWIETGERYADVALPPGSELGNSRWWHGKFHLPGGCTY